MSVPMNATKSLVFMRSRCFGCIERNVADIKSFFMQPFLKKDLLSIYNVYMPFFFGVNISSP